VNLRNLNPNNVGPGNPSGGLPIAFFSITSLNPDGLDHMLAFHSAQLSQTEFTFEDLTSGGDNDFEDMVFTVDIAPPPVNLIPLVEFR
jgi:hypothetical protein